MYPYPNRPGLRIEHIDRRDNGNPTFITFTTADAIESALQLAGTKFRGKPIKMYRSSLDQLELYRTTNGNMVRESSEPKPSTDHPSQQPNETQGTNPFRSPNKTADQAPTRQKTRMSASLTSLNAVVGVSPIDAHPIVGPTEDIPKGINCVVARGLPWRITKAQVLDFFQNVNVLDGERGVRLCRRVSRGALEARVNVASADDHDAALRLKGQPLDGRKIDGNWVLSFRMHFRCQKMIILTHHFFFCCLQSIHFNDAPQRNKVGMLMS